MFFSNYGSRKAADIAANDQVSLLFPWYAIERQLAILGPAERSSAAESLACFTSRPHGSRLGAWVSQQSAVISSRQILEMKWDEMRRKFAGGEIPLPSFWGGSGWCRWRSSSGREGRTACMTGSAMAEQPWTMERLAP